MTRPNMKMFGHPKQMRVASCDSQVLILKNRYISSGEEMPKWNWMQDCKQAVLVHRFSV